MNHMYGWSDLKKRILPGDLGYVCPVEGCSTRFCERQHRTFVCDSRFLCRQHGIFFSPSTFEYDRPERNILWGDYDEMVALTSKRESRVARSNSEDAITWNVFRFLARDGLLVDYLSVFSGAPVDDVEIIYWSHDRTTGTVWRPLRNAREAFETNPAKGSEPDVIVRTDKTLFIIEAKLTASNNTTPSHSNFPGKYPTGGGGWWAQAFAPSATYQQIAEVDKKYELMRFWLLGTWMANQAGLDFRLVNLVCGGRDDDIETRFRPCLKPEWQTKFVRKTWEDIHAFIACSASDGERKQKMLRYLEEKVVGYDREGVLQKAFSV